MRAMMGECTGDPLAVAFDHPHVHLQGVAGTEVGDVVAQTGAVDEISAVHERLP
jgi:hypothetical protein